MQFLLALLLLTASGFTMPGRYVGHYTLDQAGLHIDGQHKVIIDGGLLITAPYIVVENLEVVDSHNPRVPPDRGPGIDVEAPHVTLRGLAIHDTDGGIYAYSHSPALVVERCKLYDLGYQGSDRGHGHALYLQNGAYPEIGAEPKIISGNWIGYTYSGWGVHAYSQSGALKGLDFEGNTQVGGVWLIGGYVPASGIIARGNTFVGVDVQLGYAGAPNVQNGDLIYRDNRLLNGSKLHLGNWASIH